MAISPAIIVQLRKIVWHSLDNHMIDNATFMAERLMALDRNPDSIYLLALCYFRDGKIKSAQHLTENMSRHIGCVYIYAQCCYKRKRFLEGAEMLEKTRPLWINTSHYNRHSDTERYASPDAAAILCLLGHLHRSQGDAKGALENYVHALKLNPYLWEAFTGLCDTGANLRVHNIFKQTEEMIAMGKSNNSVSGSEFSIPEDASSQTENHGADPFISMDTTRASRDYAHSQGPLHPSKVNEIPTMQDITTPTSQGEVNFTNGLYPGSTANNMEHPKAPQRKNRTQQLQEAPRKMLTSRLRETAELTDRKRTISSTTEHLANIASATAAPARRSNRLLNTTKLTSKFAAGQREVKKPKSTTSRTRSSKLGEERADQIMNMSQSHDVTMSDARGSSVQPNLRPLEARQEDAQLYVLDMLRKTGLGHYSLARYDCEQAIEAYLNLPTNQRETSYVLSQMGKANYEIMKYKEAEALFAKVRVLDPMRLKDMEIYSTLLWHLRRDVELAHLAHELSKIDRLSPQAWCAIGNSFSLQREHDQALKCFKRASQLDEKLAYAFTLQGHEHISNEELEKALSSYRSALLVDPRHYNAWYGVGKVYEKLGKYDLAEKHFRMALSINPTNSVLVCCIGMVMERTRNFKGALIQYSQACELQPKSVLSRFKKARVLMALANFHGALIELQALRDMAPDEANVHFLLGRLYKAMHDKQSALKHFTAALHLDPKASGLIKEAIESLDVVDEDMFPHDDPDNYGMIEH